MHRDVQVLPDQSRSPSGESLADAEHPARRVSPHASCTSIVGCVFVGEERAVTAVAAWA